MQLGGEAGELPVPRCEAHPHAGEEAGGGLRQMRGFVGNSHWCDRCGGEGWCFLVPREEDGGSFRSWAGRAAIWGIPSAREKGEAKNPGGNFSPVGDSLKTKDRPMSPQLSLPASCADPRFVGEGCPELMSNSPVGFGTF